MQSIVASPIGRPGAASVPAVPRDSDGPLLIRSGLDDAGYTEAGLCEALGTRDLHQGISEERVERLRRGKTPTRLDTLIRLFLLGEEPDLDEASSALDPPGIAAWQRMGLIGVEGNQVLARVKLIPCRDLLIASDRTPAGLTSLPSDFVMGVGASSMTLAGLTVRRTDATALDMGCGCGIQALLAAHHGARVTATDVNPRAVAFAELNAALNGLQQVECRAGSLFEPVRDRTFDLIVSNPPFVVSPESTYVYRDSGLAVDEVCRSIVREAPRHLAEGGYCQMLCNWAHVRGEDWRERLAGWLEGSGCDAWVMRCETHEPSVYAATWIRHTERSRTRLDPEQYDAWMDYYEGLGIEAVSAGVISLRRTDRRGHWFRADDAPARILGSCGGAIANGFALYDFLTTTGRRDECFVEQELKLSSDARLHSELAPTSDGWEIARTRLQLVQGLAYTQDVEAATARVAALFRGGRRVCDALREAEVSDADVPGCLAALRGLVAQGFLTPVLPERS